MPRLSLLLLLCAGCGREDPVSWDPLLGETYGFSPLVFQAEPDDSELVGPHVLGGQMVLDLGPPDSGGDDWGFEVLDPEIAQAVLNRQEGPYIVELRFLKEGSTDLFVVDGRGAVLDIERLRVRTPVEARVTPYEELLLSSGGGRRPQAPLAGTVHTVQGALLDLVVSYVDRLDTALAGGRLLTVAADVPPRIDHEIVFTGEVDVLALDVGPRAPAERLPIQLLAGADTLATLDLIVHDDADVDGVILDVAEGDEGGAALARVMSGSQSLAGAQVTFSWGGRSEVGSVLLFAQDDDVPSTPVTACFAGPDGDVCVESEVPGEPTSVASRSEGERSCGCQVQTTSPRWDWLARRR